MTGTKTGIFGGTFNPPHIGHIEAAQAAAKALGLDRIIFIPTNDPPHKELPAGSPSGDRRFEMLKLAVQNIKNAEVSDIELKREGRSYSIDTLEELKKLYPDDKFYFLMGTDMFLYLEKWYRFEDIIKIAIPAVFAREDGDNSELLKFAEYLKSKYGAVCKVIDNSAAPMSSTEIRALLPKREGRDKLSEPVYACIIKNRFYSAEPDYDWLREKAFAMLNPKRVPHVKGVEWEARRLAKRWGENEDDAAQAGILHDCTKKLSGAEQLLMCEKYGIIPDSVEQKATKLLHAKTGAAIAEFEFGMKPEIVDAIRYHTTGKPDMTLLEKIVYLADYIEPNRDFEGLEELRKLAYEDMDKAMILGLQMSLDDMAQRGIEPHPDSARALEYLLDAEKNK